MAEGSNAADAGWSVTPEEQHLYALLSEEFPKDAYKKDLRAGLEIVYIEGHSVVGRLNETFGVFGWQFEVLESDINAEADEIWVRGRLTVYDHLRNREVRREQFGSQKIGRARSSGKIMNIGFNFKAAGTDALKKCATLVGVGLHLTNKEEAARMLAAVKEDELSARRAGRNQDDADQPSSTRPRPQPRSGRQNDAQPNRQPKTGDRADQSGVTTVNGVRTPQPTIINGVRMPQGFVQPFDLDMSRTDTACRATECDIDVHPDVEYKVGNATKNGAYVIKRSREESGTVLCAKHAAAWFKAKQQVSAA